MPSVDFSSRGIEYLLEVMFFWKRTYRIKGNHLLKRKKSGLLFRNPLFDLYLFGS